MTMTMMAAMTAPDGVHVDEARRVRALGTGLPLNGQVRAGGPVLVGLQMRANPKEVSGDRSTAVIDL